MLQLWVERFVSGDRGFVQIWVLKPHIPVVEMERRHWDHGPDHTTLTCIGYRIFCNVISVEFPVDNFAYGIPLLWDVQAFTSSVQRQSFIEIRL